MPTKSNTLVLAQAEEQWQLLANDSKYTEAMFHKQYKMGRVVGQGVWGIVSNVCLKPNRRLSGKRKMNKTNCDALKRVKINRAIDFQTADMDTQYLHYLKDVRLGLYKIVPKVKHMWISETTGKQAGIYYNLLMSKYDGNMYYLCVKARPNKLPTADLRQDWKKFRRDRRWKFIQGIYYRSELLRIYAIAWLLGQQGVIHGDLKPDQYLFNYGANKSVPVKEVGTASDPVKEVGTASDPVKEVGTASDPVKDIAVTDFGFAGLITAVRHKQNTILEKQAEQNPDAYQTTKRFGLAEMGWPSNSKSPSAFGTLPSGLIALQTCKEASFMNLAMLETFLISDGQVMPTLIIDDRKPLHSRRICFFTGVNDFISKLKTLTHVKAWFPSAFFEEYARCQRVWQKDDNWMTFDCEEIQKEANRIRGMN
jgi:serine/threonine protein kinase